jgi:hypothetical protein
VAKEKGNERREKIRDGVRNEQNPSAEHGLGRDENKMVPGEETPARIERPKKLPHPSDFGAPEYYSKDAKPDVAVPGPGSLQPEDAPGKNR